jgi:hypothetical protein
MLDADFVVTVGEAAGTNVWSLPRAVPASLDAMRRKWYVAPLFNPVTCATTETGLVPDPASFALVLEP